MLIQLKSNFQDYYDHHFTGSWQTPDVVFPRFSNGGLSRPEMFALLSKHNIATPTHGFVKEVVPELKEALETSDFGFFEDYLEVVVYLDEYAHKGEQKIRLTYNEALAKYPKYFCAEYVPVLSSGTGVSFRHLRIGLRQFWLQYVSLDDWRSNCGDVQIEVLREEERINDPKDVLILQDRPLVAVDFIPYEDHLLAIDVNTAPGLQKTGIEDYMVAKDVFEEIKDYLEKYWDEDA